MTPSTLAPASRAGRRPRFRAAAVAGAAAAAAVGWLLAVPPLGVDLEVVTAGRTTSVGIGAVVAVSLGAGLLGWAVLALLERTTRHAIDRWTGLAVLTTLVSFGGPVTAAATAASAVSLVLLHVAVAAVLVLALRRTSQAPA